MDSGRALLKVFMSLFLGLGVLLLFGGYFMGPTPEHDLTLVEGVPRDIDIEYSTASRRYGDTSNTLKFRVGEYLLRVRPYVNKALEAVRTAARRGESVKVRVNTKTMIGHLNYGRDFAELYQLTVGNDQIITYQDIASKVNRDNELGIPIGWILFGLGLAILLWLKVA